jgi:hypothetical protein
MMSMWRRVRAKVPNVALGVIIGLMVGGGALAIAQTTSEDAVHGGPKPRFHDAGECNLVNVGTLSGNWTHGDYVSAVAKKDPSKVREAAKSRCGKPVHASKGKGKGPKDKDRDSQGKPAAKPSKSPKPSPKPSASPTPSATGTAPAGPTLDATPSPTTTASASS